MLKIITSYTRKENSTSKTQKNTNANESVDFRCKLLKELKSIINMNGSKFTSK